MDTVIKKLELPTSLTSKSPARKARSTPWTKPVYITKLSEKIGTKKAADAIGVTPALVSEAVRKDSTTLRVENAAMGIWLRDHEPKKVGDQRTVVLRIGKDAWSQLRPFLQSQGIQSVEL